jgi:hypothetical protein
MPPRRTRHPASFPGPVPPPGALHQDHMNPPYLCTTIRCTTVRRSTVQRSSPRCTVWRSSPWCSTVRRSTVRPTRATVWSTVRPTTAPSVPPSPPRTLCWGGNPQVPVWGYGRYPPPEPLRRDAIDHAERAVHEDWGRTAAGAGAASRGVDNDERVKPAVVQPKKTLNNEVSKGGMCRHCRRLVRPRKGRRNNIPKTMYPHSRHWISNTSTKFCANCRGTGYAKNTRTPILKAIAGLSLQERERGAIVTSNMKT